MQPNDDEIPVSQVLIQYAGSFPISDDAIFNVLERLIDAKTMPINLAISSARYPMRVVNALLTELDSAGSDMTLRVCGQYDLLNQPLAHQAILAEGYWLGESNPITLRAFLIDVTIGVHPKDAAKKYKISETEMLHLDNLLELENHWYSTILERVLNIRASGGRWFAVARELCNYNPYVIWTWIRLAKRVEKELKKSSGKNK